MKTEAPARAGPAPQHERSWDAAALVVFVLASCFLHRAILTQDWTQATPFMVPQTLSGEPFAPGQRTFFESDQQFVVWLVSRNARTLLTRPFSFFDAEPCFPVEQSLALGEPGVDAGLLGMPAWLLTRDPVATFNVVLFVLPVLSALAMYWVVKRWTGLPAAGLVAGLLYGFHSLKVHDPVHFYIYDTLWLVLALFFAERLFRLARWPDALALAAVTSMQLTTSLYPLLASVIAGGVFLVWLVIRDGVRDQKPAQWVVMAAIVLCVAVLLFRPVLTLAGDGEIEDTTIRFFRPLAFYLPGQKGFPGWPSLLLIVAAFVLPVRKSLPGLAGDVRWPLVIGIVLIHALSIGSISGEFAVGVVREEGQGWPPNLYMALATFVPGLGLGRGPGTLFNCAVMLVALLVGIGAAGLLRRLPSRFLLATTGLLLLVFFIDMLRPPVLGLPAHYELQAHVVRPAEDLLDFYAELEARGNTGPMLLVPVMPQMPLRESLATLLTAYHGRRTGQCYNSHHTPAILRVRELSQALPEPWAVAALADMGFTTLVVAHDAGDARGMRLRRTWAVAAAAGDAAIREVHHSRSRTAYAIVDPVGG